MRLAESSINRRIGALQRAWRRAEDLWGWQLPRVAWGRLKGTEPEPRDRSVPRDLRAAFIEALPERTRYLFLLAFHTGLRRGALLYLTAEKYNWAEGIIHTYSKGKGPQGKYTPIPITDAVCAVMQAYGRMPESGPLFPVTLTMIRKDVERATKATGYKVTLHQGRHSFAQDLEDAGHGEAITGALHHSDPKLKLRYSRQRIDRLREVLEQVQGAKER